MTPEEELKYYKKAYSREKLARKEAERILESKAEELYYANNKLLDLNLNLESNLALRTEQIKEAEKEFSLLVESANLMIYKTDIDGHFTYINPTGERISGYSSKELIGKDFTDIVNISQRRKMVLFYRKQGVNCIDSTYFEYQIKTKLGEEVWIGQNVQLIKKDNVPTGFWAVGRDITERITRDIELKNSNLKYKSLFEGAFDGVIRLDAKRCFVEWNSKMEVMLGYSAEELKGMHITNVLYDEDIEHSKSYLAKLVKDGFYTNYIGRIKNKSGRVIDIEVNSRATFEGGKISGSIDSVRDITERKSLEKAIIRSEEKYRGIIENLDFGLLEVDIRGLIVKAYPSFCKLTGYEPDELIGRNPLQFLHPDFVSVMQEKEELREKGISDVYEVQIKKKSGAYIWVIISGAPFYNEKGELSGSIGVHLDISSQKKMENDLIKANGEALASSKAKELFLANMSHEIRTPLNAVFGLSNLLKNTDLDENQIAYVQNINNSAKSLLLLVNDILDMSKIESGKLESNRTKFNLSQSIGTILASTSFLAEQKNLDLKLFIDPKLNDYYLGDELKICQVLINLINNAIKFTNAGSVTLKIEKVYDSRESHQVRFSVIDTGKGIAQEAIDSIFEDFTQEDSTISKEYGGTGLGLSISKKLVSILGGDLKVNSLVDNGTTFHFKILLEIAEEINEPIEELSSLHFDWAQLKILTVEDNPVNQFVIQSTINSWGGQTDIADNGQDAIGKIREKDYDIILMDMQMPIMDGIATTKYIRQEMNLEIPILAFTANALKKEKERCLSIGMDDYITKPFQEDELKIKILNLVSNQNIQKDSPHNEDTQVNELFTITKLEELSRGDNSFVLKMLTIFIEDSETQLEHIKKSVNPEEISKIAHKIKPSLDYLANDHMKNLVRKIEKMDFLKDDSMLAEFISTLRILIDESRKYLQK